MSAPIPMFVWKGRCTRVIDGDTIEVQLDTGFHTIHTERLRLLGVDTPEVRGETYAAGMLAKAYVQALMKNIAVDSVGKTIEWPLTVQTHKSDSFGRYLADVWSSRNDPLFQGMSLSELLIIDGHGIKA